MLKRLLSILGAVLLLGSIGCSSAGPFITNISSDGNGNIIIEKGYVVHDGFLGVIYNGGKTTTTKIRIHPSPIPRPQSSYAPKKKFWTGEKIQSD